MEMETVLLQLLKNQVDLLQVPRRKVPFFICYVLTKPAEEISLDDLVDSVLEGNSEAVELYLDNLNKPEEEKNKIREELVRRFEEKMISRLFT